MSIQRHTWLFFRSFIKDNGHLFWLASGIGIFATVIAALIGLNAYEASRQAHLQAAYDYNLILSREIGAQLSDRPEEPLGVRIDSLLNRWKQREDNGESISLSVINQDGQLLAHSIETEQADEHLNRKKLVPDTPRGPNSIERLLSVREDWQGKTTDTAGNGQLSAYTYCPQIDALIGVHRSEAAFAADFRGLVKRWQIAFLVTVFLLWPGCLLLTHLCFRRYHRDSMRDEARLRTQFRELEHVYRTAPIGLCLFNREQQFVRVNDAFAKISGRRIDEHFGTTIDNICPKIAEQVQGACRSVLKTGEPVLDIQLSKCRGDESAKLHLLFSFHPLKNDDDNVIGVSTVVQDISRRTETEQALAKREALYRALVENSFDVINLFSSTGELLYTSPSMQRVLGYDSSELVGKIGLDLVHPDDVETAMAGFQEVLESPCQVAHLIHRLRHKDGSYRTVEITGSNMLDVDGINAMVSIFRDITKRKQAERALSESESRFRRLCTNAPVGIFLCDANGHCTYANEQTQAILKVETVAPLHGPGWIDFLHEDDRDGVLADWAESAASQSPFVKEYRMVSTDGNVNWVLCNCLPQYAADGQIEFFMGTLVDVTNQKTSQLELQESELRYRTLVENAAEAIVLLDVDTQKFIDANERALEFFDCDEQTLRQLGPIDFSPPVQPDGQSSVLKATKMINLALTGETPAFEWIHVDRHQRPLECEIRLAKMPSSSRRLVRGCIADISARKRNEATIREQQSQLAHVSRLSTMGEMVAGIAHEVNQPLSSVTNFANACFKTIRNGHYDPQLLLEWINDIQGEAMRAGEIIKRIASFTRKGEDNFERVDLNQLIFETVGLVYFHTNKHGVRIHLNLSDEPVLVLGDRVQLQQVLVNLIRNAAEACEGVDPENRSVTITTSCENSQWIVEITDRGVGLPENHEESMFDAFFTTKAEGMGMGLGISRTIVETHKGQMFAKSNLDCGATVGFALPLFTDDDHRASDPELHGVCR